MKGGKAAAFPQATPPWRQAVSPLLLLLVVAVVYGRVCGHGFLDYDDNLNIYENPLLANLSPANLLRFWTKPYEGLYIPLTYTLWSLLTGLSALFPPADGSLFNPHLFHGANLLGHGANTVLLFCLLRLVVRNTLAAAGGALLFALHPVQVEPVAWVTGFKGVLCGLFSLITLWQYAWHCQAPAASPSGWSRHYLLAVVAFLAALLTMPSAVVLPMVAGIVGALFGRPWPRLARELLPWLLLVLPVVILTKLSQPDTQHAFLPSVGQRLLIAGDTLAFYVGKLVAPFTVTADYGRTPQLVLSQPWSYATGLLPYGLGAVFLWRVRDRYLLAGAGIMVVVLAPVLGLVSFTFQDTSTVADRYLYLAMVGPALVVAALLTRYQTVAFRLALGLILALLAAKSVVQVGHWHDSLAFNTYTLSANPNSWLAYHNLGLLYYEQNQPEKAIDQYQKVLALKPRSFKAYNNLGMIYNRLGRKEEAIASYKQALAIKPDYALVCNNIAVIYKELGNYEQAIAYYRQALALNPEFAEVYANLGNLYRQIDRPDEALPYYQKAVALRPSKAEIYNDLGLTYKAMGKPEEAIANFRKALALKPEFAEVHANLGVVYKEQGNIPEAIAAFRQAVATAPELVDAYVNLGFLLAASNQQAEAVRVYQKAISLSPTNEIPHYALGLLYLDQGQDQAAADSFQQAIGINPDFGPAYNGLSRLSLRQGQYEQAIDLADKASALGFGDQQQLDALAPFRKQ